MEFNQSQQNLNEPIRILEKAREKMLEFRFTIEVGSDWTEVTIINIIFLCRLRLVEPNIHNDIDNLSMASYIISFLFYCVVFYFYCCGALSVGMETNVWLYQQG